MIMTVRNCITCNRHIKGRKDKKFCSDSCRSNYNNLQNSDATSLIRNVNNILRKNRRILLGFMGGSDKPVVIEKDRLMLKGFRVEFFTGQFKNDHNEVYYYCYEYGYRLLDGDLCMVVKSKKRDWLPLKKKAANAADR
jgi:predicted nucleic acid-binding Zn ribbon protein